MPQIQTTLTSYDKREGTGQRGAWVLHLYKDAAGTTYQTFEAPISNRAYGLLSKPVVLTYEDKASRKTDAQGNLYPPNKEIKDIQPDATAQAPTVAPVTSQGTPSVPPTLTPTGSFGDGDRQVQIMRQSALERAILWIGIFGGEDTLYRQSEEFLHYFQTGEYPGRAPQSGATGEYPGKSEGEFLAAVGNEFPDAA